MWKPSPGSFEDAEARATWELVVELRTAVPSIDLDSLAEKANEVGPWVAERWPTFGAGVAQRLHSSPGFVIVLYGVAIVGVGLSVYVHELGHLIAALLLRCPISEVAALARARTGGRMIGGVRIRLGLFGKASHVHAFPTQDASAARARLLVLYAAGAAANVVFAAAIYLATMSLAMPKAMHGSLLTVAAVSSFLGIMSLIPVTFGDRPTDGALIVRWLLKPSGLRTALVLEDLRRRAQTPGNRWRRFEDLRDASDKRWH